MDCSKGPDNHGRRLDAQLLFYNRGLVGQYQLSCDETYARYPESSPGLYIQFMLFLTLLSLRYVSVSSNRLRFLIQMVDKIILDAGLIQLVVSLSN